VKISDLIRGLEAVKSRYGDIEIARADGQPISLIEIDGRGNKPIARIDLGDFPESTRSFIGSTLGTPRV